ncbi:hypothetical protein EDD73_12241 [Heliophilum fasciatum]|uniref:Uncharacterized protein n=1 Tax=Heliophilum fasciatum TaxID=35700 RepID=A0A4R2RFR6_9FIRM|nr:hypothetical protein EDD73_12241 [Heliophilum fasciatum]
MFVHTMSSFPLSYAGIFQIRLKGSEQSPTVPSQPGPTRAPPAVHYLVIPLIPRTKLLHQRCFFLLVIRGPKKIPYHVYGWLVFSTDPRIGPYIKLVEFAFRFLIREKQRTDISSEEAQRNADDARVFQRE